MRLILDEQFPGSELNEDNWEYEVTSWGGGNREFQMYTPEKANTYVRDGTLFIRPTLSTDKFGDDLTRGPLDLTKLYGRCTVAVNWGGLPEPKKFMLPIMSGRINCKVAFKYGRVEVMAKMPRGDWLWPAIWLLPRQRYYGGWPRSGEIDLVEGRGNRNYGDIGVGQMSSSIHFGTSWKRNCREIIDKSYNVPGSGTWADGMHKYVLDWDEAGIRTYVDGVEVLNVETPTAGYFRWGNFPGANVWSSGTSAAPFDIPFYLTLNVAVGGKFFDDDVHNLHHPKPWTCDDVNAPEKFWEARNNWLTTWDGEDAAMQVDYIKIWEKT